MRYAVRKKGTDTFLTESARYGSLDDAFIYDDLEIARGDVYTSDEIVEVNLTVGAVVAEAAVVEADEDGE